MDESPESNRPFPVHIEDVLTTPIPRMNRDTFQRIDILLQGNKCFKEPRVDKRVLVRALRQQNLFIMQLVKDFGDFKKVIHNLIETQGTQEDRLKHLSRQQLATKQAVERAKDANVALAKQQKEIMFQVEKNSRDRQLLVSLGEELNTVKRNQQVMSRSMAEFKEEVSKVLLPPQSCTAAFMMLCSRC